MLAVAVVTGVLAGEFLAGAASQLDVLEKSTAEVSEELKSIERASENRTAGTASPRAEEQLVQFRSRTSYDDITWWDLISPEEFTYYEEQMQKYEEDYNYSGDGSVPPEPGINPEIDGVAVRIPGYAVGVDSVPGEFNRLKTFLFVPYQGACIHVPPPPPNQTVYVIMDKPVSTDPYLPVYLEGHIYLDEGENDIAAYYYRFEGDKISEYTDGY